jgi:Lrp/AsnC family leucine-responsive transcriptional regulator
MDQNTDEVRRKRPAERELDAMDRKLLGVLVEDATISYADLGERAGLSPPAAHERVKRLRRSGAIRRMAALIDPDALGKTLLAFVHVDTTGWGKTTALLAIEECPEVEEIHSVAGDTCMLLKVRTESTHALEGLLARLYATPGVKATRSYVVLSTYLERPVQPGATSEWPALVKSDSVAG